MKSLSTYISHMKDFHSLNEYLNEKLIINKDYTYKDPDENDELIVVIKTILHDDEQNSDTCINYPQGKLQEYVKDLVKDIIKVNWSTKFLKYIDSNDKKVNDWFNDADCSEGAYMNFTSNRFTSKFIDKIYYELWEPLVIQKQADDFFKTYITKNTFVVFYSCKYKNYIVSFIEDTDKGEILGCIIVKRK